tara:strand:- start:682 stop:1431 length:750 start_codon:yes stop_codon:yes gene_type:complete
MTAFLKTPQNRKIAYHQTPAVKGDLPGVIFCGGFMSDMTGSKATAFEDLCKSRGQAYVRFDYSGHGQSGDQFTDGTIGKWAEDTYAVFEELTKGPQIVVGSSMGGWMALLLALRYPERVQGLIGIAAAPDFVTEHFESAFTDIQKQELGENGITYVPSGYEHPYPITRALIEDGKEHVLLTGDIDFTGPVRLIQGTEDEAVESDKPERTKKALTSEDVLIHMIEGGNHSLSRPEDIEVIDSYIRELSGL